MTNYDASRWMDSEFAGEYRDNANGYIPNRHLMIQIVQSLYQHQIYVKDRAARVLDLGCGDGLFVDALWKVDAQIDATLVDGSAEMLDAARQRLAGLEHKRLVQASFQDLLAKDTLEASYDLILSSLAIHHLRGDEKEALFQYIYNHLNPGGMFLNADVVLAPSDELEQWYLTLWREWIGHYSTSDLLGVPQRYKDNSDNVPDRLMMQLQALEHIGFRQVDCYYKFGIFVMFGGRRI
jgi:tRNA (cmo5U34)-methyltransferase